MNTLTTAAAPEVSGRTRLSGALTRRWPTGLGIAATLVSLALVSPLPGRVQTWISAWGVLTAAVIYLTWGTARGELAAARWLTAQTGAVLAFAAVAITAAAADPTAARYVLAAGWLAHAAWDVAHHRANRVVPRWYAETCLVCDVILATALLTVGTT
ncbi:DUF6010 family protein [Nocardioides mesophilus]|uniref:Uncharacterized protein n=1 Tax=Nocardioides mesophilus TaxID=433659 RepID=A0A7G9R8B0_9ACTN|nr:DUF6010 family protein [Nocardioides mesophilus]QNN51835.1 hypothetical protein H9L09_14990 [Nocardioides mesophilus]